MSCRKVTRYSPDALTQIRPLLEGGVTTAERDEIIRITFGDFLDTWGFPREHRGLYRTVPRDPSRRFLRKRAWIQEHFKTRGRPRGHGFSQASVRTGEAHYSFRPAAGIRFIVVDTVADNASSGNVDEAQFSWLDAQVTAAETRREPVLVFGHHSLRTMNAPGTGVRNGADVESLLRRHPGDRYLAGHEHRNRIEPHGSFWELVTASHLEGRSSRACSRSPGREGRSRSTRPRSTTTPGRDRIARAAWRDWRRSRASWRSTSHRRRTARTARRIAAGRRSTATSRPRTESVLSARYVVRPRMRPDRRLLCSITIAGALLVLSGAAGAAEGDPYLKSCYASPNALRASSSTRRPRSRTRS